MTFADLVYGFIVPAIDSVVIPLLYAIAFIMFLVGMVRYFFSDNEDKRKQGRGFAIWSIIALVVIFSVWGLVRLLISVIAP
ncbi:pilin [Candidatus Parcubacteria bacterium]|nr:pilin [Candidatus Parcubacteria bacterium]